jgi:hypothetical protein
MSVTNPTLKVLQLGLDEVEVFPPPQLARTRVPITTNGKANLRTNFPSFVGYSQGLKV